MKKNIGTLDRYIRILIAVVIGILYFTGVISDTLALILGAVAIILLLTSFVNFCPIWAAFGIDTRKKNHK